MTEIELDIMPDGTIRFCRRDPQTNERIHEIISALAPSQSQNVREFLDCSQDIVPLFGDEPLCG